MAIRKNVKVITDRTQGLLKGLAYLAENRVYAGVPATKAERTDEVGEINNAALMYIHEHGAPEANIPARPVVNPAIKKNQGAITAALRASGKAALDGSPEGAGRGLNAAGLIAQNGMRERITTGPFVPLSPKTVAQRAAKRGTRRRKGETLYLEMIKSGVTPAVAQAEAGIKPLIDTGQLRRALTYVVRQVTWHGRKNRLG